jgi:4-amino-4-deoxy-L-arabinose transferase-like glycosyltransferase
MADEHEHEHDERQERMADSTASTSNTGADTGGIPRQAARLDDASAKASIVRVSRFSWARYPEFWIILLIAAFLRLWHLDHSQWLDDQAQLLTLARDAWVRGRLPITGIRSSINTLNPPLSVYILMPFFLFTRSPLPALIGLALWNVLGVALCYLFALRYFNRRVAFCSALVFACCGAAVNYSRFIWQQNYLSPLLLLWAFTLYAGAIRGRRAWLALHLLLLAMIISLHPTGLTLLAVTVVALVIAPRWPTRRDVLLSAALVALLALPTLLWELVSNFSDVQLLRQFSQQRSVFNFDVFHAFDHIIGAPAYPHAGYNTPYPNVLDTALFTRIAGLNDALQHVAALLYIGCYIILSILALAPLRRVRTVPANAATGWRRYLRTAWTWLLALRQAIQADTRWRAYLLLWLWLTFPPLTMLRHGKTVQPHYLFILYPALFLSVGVATDAVTREGPRLLAGLRIQVRDAREVVTWAALAAVLLFATGQGIQTTIFLAAVGGNEVNNSNFGYPVNQLLAADGAISTMQRDQHAGQVVVSMPSPYTASALTSTLVREQSTRTGVTGDCLVLPAPESAPALIVSTQAASPQARLLAGLPNATLVQDYPMPGNEPLMIYRLNGQTPLLPGERALPAATWQSGNGEVLRLVAGARTDAGVIRLRWVVGRWTIAHGDGAANISDAPRYEIRATSTTPASAQVPVAGATCQPTHLEAGETLFTWVTTNWSAEGTSLTAKAPPLPETPLTLTLRRGTAGLWQGRIGPIRVLSGARGGEPLVPMELNSPTGTDSSYRLPADLTGLGAP